MDDRTTVLVLGGGPDAERAVSIDSAQNVSHALRAGEQLNVVERTIDRITLEELGAMQGDVIFAALHGPWGEGGPMQELLEADSRPFVGCDAGAAQLAMDKEATKSVARATNIPTPDSVLFDPVCESCPLSLPVVVKPIAEGSTIGLHICRTQQEWQNAHAATTSRGVAAMVERFVVGRELTVGVVCCESLAVIEIEAASGFYDFAAKYDRDDTRYTPCPELPEGMDAYLHEQSLLLCGQMGCDSLARVDWMLSRENEPMMLEVNTMPGFTSHSLLPMAAAQEKMTLTMLCERLVRSAIERSSRARAKNEVVMT